jgi:tRNA (guanine-N7-)-methyltransferase
MNPLRLSPWPESPPRPWTEVFGREAPLEVDIGFGRGHFLLDRAAQAPQVNLVGIELRRKWVATVRSQIERLHLENARVLEGEAARLIAHHFQPGEVHRFYVFFPDPWWKRRHQKRRLFNPEFAALLSSRLAPGGRLFAQSDVWSYATEILALLEATPGLRNARGPFQLGPWEEDLPLSPRERRCRQDGVPCYQMAFVRGDEGPGVHRLASP